MVSPRHAGFIVNMGRATAADVYALIRRIEATVMERFGVQLFEVYGSSEIGLAKASGPVLWIFTSWRKDTIAELCHGQIRAKVGLEGVVPGVGILAKA